MEHFVLSDHHLFHKNIIEYEQRPFSSLENMHKTIIKNHNNVVTKKDKIFLLGDLSFGNKVQTQEIIEQMNGYKILVLGNHDNRSRKWYLDIGINEVIKYPIIYNKFYILSHEPLHLTPSIAYVNIHGHTHSNKMENVNYFNVCVENHGYTPVNLKDIVKKYN